jgi:hypothetical protein
MIKTSNWIRAAGVLAMTALTIGCDDALSGPELDTDPNRPSIAEIEQVFHAVQLNTFFWHTGNVARAASMWTQQMAGTDRQYISYDNYELTVSDFNEEWDAIYTSGGLVDMRKVQAMGEAMGDRTYIGIAKVHEALMMGMVASIWGAVPYSEAAGEVATPRFDAQQDVYAAIQTLLTEAIADLGVGDEGPGDLDLIYGGDRVLWTRAANTLKARFYMHWVEAQAAGGVSATAATAACGGPCLDRAITSAAAGIAAASGDMVSFHTETPGEQNLWYQFISVFRPGYLSAGAQLVNQLRTRNDPRLGVYFDRVNGQYVGAPVGTSGTYSQLNPATRGASGFDQPLVTFAENQLILAEAYARTNQRAQTITALNAARTGYGLTALTYAGTVPLATILTDVRMEKYFAMFQNIEAWNDMKRNCTPALVPPAGAPATIARIFYSDEEANANPNTPAIGTLFDRNPNDPTACPRG